MNQQQEYSRYLRLVLAIGLGTLLIVGAINLMVDPFGAIGLVRVEGFNHKKNAVENGRERLATALQLWAHPAQSIFLGSSAMSVGIDPARVPWAGNPASGYNAGLPGANMYEILRYYQHAARVTGARDFTVGLELMAFIYGDRPTGNFSESWLAVSPDGRPQPPWLYALPAALFSLPALEASFETVRDQKLPGPPYADDGFRPVEAMERRNAQMGGHRMAFEKLQKWRPSFQLRGDMNGSLDRNLGHFRTMVRDAYQKDRHLRIFFSPRHVWSLEAHALEGRWELLEKWKTGIVKIVDEEARLAGKNSFPVWDFNTFNHYTTEPIPPESRPDAPMQWHWEWSHYKSALGDLVLARIAPEFCEAQAPPGVPLFGVCLSSASLAGHLASVRSARDEFDTAHPELRAAVEAAIAAPTGQD